MGQSVQNVVSIFSKQKLIAYFLLLWAAYFFFNAISGFVYEFSNMSYYGGVQLALYVITDIIGLGAAAVLAMLGLKLLNPNETL